MQNFYVGGYTQESLRLCTITKDKGTPKIQVLETYDIPNASYLCFSPDKKRLYAVIEMHNGKEKHGGTVIGFDVGPATGKLKTINSKSTTGHFPCHLSTNKDGTKLYVTNYGSGTTSTFDFYATGRIKSPRKIIDHADFGMPSGANQERQKGLHAHYVNIVDDVTWICDLGMDAVLALDPARELLHKYETPPGFGPRHMAFHPTKPIAYVVGELASAVIKLDYCLDGNLTITPSPAAKTLERGDDNSTCAAVRISPDGKHLLVSNRGNNTNSISVFDLDESGNIGKLKQEAKTNGKCPRDFAFDPTGEYVLVANQESNSVDVFDCDNSGVLTFSGVSLETAKPTCILFA